MRAASGCCSILCSDDDGLDLVKLENAARFAPVEEFRDGVRVGGGVFLLRMFAVKNSTNRHEARTIAAGRCSNPARAKSRRGGVGTRPESIAVAYAGPRPSCASIKPMRRYAAASDATSSGTLRSAVLAGAAAGNGSTFQPSCFCGLVFIGVMDAINVSGKTYGSVEALQIQFVELSRTGSYGD